jgi:hypothetical protein
MQFSPAAGAITSSADAAVAADRALGKLPISSSDKFQGPGIILLGSAFGI